MDAPRRLSDLVPPEFLDLIRDRIKAGIADAEAKYDLHREDEDAVTGALGQAISTARPMVFRNGESQFSYEISSYKIRGRGPNAPEKRLGADGIFQVAVTSQNSVLFRKGLPFQAKIGGGFENTTVLGQAGDMLRTSDSGIVVRYSPEGYTGVDVRRLPESTTSLAGSEKPRPKKLTTLLGDDFLDCNIGIEGLFYDRSKNFGEGIGGWAITTHIKNHSLRED